MNRILNLSILLTLLLSFIGCNSTDKTVGTKIPPAPLAPTKKTVVAVLPMSATSFGMTDIQKLIIALDEDIITYFKEKGDYQLLSTEETLAVWNEAMNNTSGVYTASLNRIDSTKLSRVIADTIETLAQRHQIDLLVFPQLRYTAVQKEKNAVEITGFGNGTWATTYSILLNAVGYDANKNTIFRPSAQSEFIIETLRNEDEVLRLIKKNQNLSTSQGAVATLFKDL